MGLRCVLAPLPPAQHPRAPLSALHAGVQGDSPAFAAGSRICGALSSRPPLPGARTPTEPPLHAYGAHSTHTRLGAAPAGLGEDVWAPQSRCHSFPPAFSLQLALRATGRGLPHAPIPRANAKKLLRRAKSERAELSQPLSNQDCSAFPPACIEPGKKQRCFWLGKWPGVLRTRRAAPPAPAFGSCAPRLESRGPGSQRGPFRAL